MLSRPPIPKISATSTVMKLVPFTHEVYGEEYLEDADFADIYQQMKSDPNADLGDKSEFHLQDGLLYKLGKLCIPNKARAQLIREAHSSKVAGHFGVGKTVANLQRYVYWPKMQEQVSKFIRGCVLCSTSKPSNRKLGLYMPLPVPNRPWESISMDFVGGLPLSKKGHDYLFVVVDRFSKMCILMPCKKTINGQDAAQLFFSNVWVHFGLPNSIVSDRDSRFLGKFWTTLWEKMDTKLQRSTAFHPQTDGQTEVVNRTLVQLLRGYNKKYPKTWDENMTYIQHSYNRALHTSTQKSPFETCFGFLPPSPFDVVYGEQGNDKQVESSEESKAMRFIERIKQIHLKVQEQLKESQAKYKLRHDQHRQDHNFHVGDKVWLYLSRERLQGKAKKLKPLRYGPFDIVEQISNNAFRLNLPPYMRMYSVINVENLRLFEPSMLDEELDEQVLPSIDDFAPSAMEELQEDCVLQKKVRATRRGQQEIWQVGLKGKLPKQAKWYGKEKVEELFPHLLLQN